MTSKPYFNVHVIDAVVQNSSSGTILASYIIRPVRRREQKKESFFSVKLMQWVYGDHIYTSSDSVTTRDLNPDVRLLGDIE